MKNQKSAPVKTGSKCQKNHKSQGDSLKLFGFLMNEYGPMGWWPVKSEWQGRGYHPGTYGIPRTRIGAFEVCMGAVLTQNTAWTQAEKALDVLFEQDIRTAEAILEVESSILENCIRPAGYWRQKASYLVSIAHWFIENYDGIHSGGKSLDCVRSDLLKVRGIGPETADSILLYGFHLPTFVIDAYTRRVCQALKLADGNATYSQLRTFFMENLPCDVVLYQEFHALFVQHAKLHYVGKEKVGEGAVTAQGGPNHRPPT